MSGPRKGVGLSSWPDTVPCAHPQVARGQGCCSDLTASNLGGHLWATALASVRGAWASGSVSAAARAGLALDTEHSTTSLLGTTCSHLQADQLGCGSLPVSWSLHFSLVFSLQSSNKNLKVSAALGVCEPPLWSQLTPTDLSLHLIVALATETSF